MWKQREVDTRRLLDDAGVQAVIERMIKQGKDAPGQFREGGRADLVGSKKSSSIKVLQAYLPQQFSDTELDTLIAECIDAAGASSLKDLGKVMGIVKTRARGPRGHEHRAAPRVRTMPDPVANAGESALAFASSCGRCSRLSRLG